MSEIVSPNVEATLSKGLRQQRKFVLALSWGESVWNPEDYDYTSVTGAKLFQCFTKGWTGLRLSIASGYELRAIRKLCADPAKLMIVRMPYGTAAVVGGEYVGSEYYEVWFATKALALDAHELLLSLPVRSKWGVTNFPVDRYVKSMLRGYNYLYLKNRQKDASGHYPKGVISMQKFDDVEKLLAILALMR